MATTPAEGLDPVSAIALVGAVGIGAQWLAWRLRVPGIVLMLLAGVLVGPVFGLLDPERDIGPITDSVISIAVAVILFEGGLTLNFHALNDAAKGVRRLVFLGAPLGWLTSALALRYGAGLSWESSAVFGGIMIVTGPTVIAPLLRQARLERRPATLLQWEAIVNDPIGALAAVLAYGAIIVLNGSASLAQGVGHFVIGVGVATALGLAGGWGIAWSFRTGRVPEFMKVPVLVAVLLAVFALSDLVLHESGLLAVTLMGVVIANADLPSYEELRRFKEHATILLVSGVFILLAADLDFSTLAGLDWRAVAFVAATVLLARPAAVLLALAGSGLPWKERILVAFTGPRGVVLVAVAGLFGSLLAGLGIEDGALLGPLAFVLVSATVVLHGFTLAPFARWLGLSATGTPGVLLVGGSRFTAGLAAEIAAAEIPVRVVDTNLYHLRGAREAGVPIFYGDILGESAEQQLHMVDYGTLLAATDNDAYNTLVATDLAPEFGRDRVFQLARYKGDAPRHALPSTLGGRAFAGGLTYGELEQRLRAGWQCRTTRLTAEFPFAAWQEMHPEAVPLARLDGRGIAFDWKEIGEGERLIALTPPRAAVAAAQGTTVEQAAEAGRQPEEPARGAD
ncbi:K(+)/H(+) antiporter NhaP [Pseudoruegeria aquimaris]|uniref:K(+)/H(+) antiporter NhaP n=1 Tax=Pseudoruegeria aquimaris TaxID=393663 RepID=A0A1Y5RA91_9RHOB|nr:sodium:proton antiporter [Pseudoruegeria aquimaris]SLN12743.1 K(+)/H(+) antiporter NhaP [Pseudoruegeria aquimaris]